MADNPTAKPTNKSCNTYVPVFGSRYALRLETKDAKNITEISIFKFILIPLLVIMTIFCLFSRLYCQEVFLKHCIN